jgi:Tfp pilus assembly major pilin PilA
MKKIYNKTGATVRLRSISMMTAVLLASLFAGCSNESLYDKEMYHPVIYLLSSDDDYNRYTVVIPFKESNPVTYISVGCGGSKANPEEVTVVLERDNNDLFDLYNYVNFETDTDKFARLLPQSRYEIPSFTATLPANSTDSYANVAVRVNQQGLSPDSTYFIPIAIKSVSRYEVNTEKSNMLMRIAIINDYAEQTATTAYSMKGTLNSATVTGSKVVQPLSANEVRFFAGIQTQNNQSTVEDIAKYAITAKINSDNTVSLRPYGTMELEMLEQEGYNRYYTQYDELTGRNVQYMDLYYRYRTLKTPATPEAPAEWDDWIEIREMLKRENYPTVIK